ncbi:MAG: hydroxyphenylacetyl-CoA thioesterase PaaI [Halocynthiibacter sp.]
MTPEERAKKSADCMWSTDSASQHLGMDIQSVGPGTAVITMKVQEFMLNGHRSCHGGYIFTLADSAFAFACNSYNENTVAQHCSVSYLAPGREGMTLTATASENFKAGRSGIYDIKVTDETGAHIAQFRGHSRQIKGTHFEEDNS